MIEVLLPYYGDPHVMQEAVDSVRSQTCDEWQLLIVDDAYPDPTISRWVNDLQDPRIRYRRNHTTLGVRGNFARALSMAASEHIVFMGCDDVMLPNYVESVTQTLRAHPRAAMVQPRVEVIDTSGAPARPVTDRVKSFINPLGDHETVLSGQALAARLMVGNWLYFPAVTWRRDLVAELGFRPGLETVLDLALELELVLGGHELVLTPEVAFHYRRHAASASSLTARSSHRFAEEKALFDEMRRRFAQRGWRYAAGAARLHPTSRLHALTMLAAAARRGDRALTGRLLRHAAI